MVQVEKNAKLFFAIFLFVSLVFAFALVGLNYKQMPTPLVKPKTEEATKAFTVSIMRLQEKKHKSSKKH